MFGGFVATWGPKFKGHHYAWFLNCLCCNRNAWIAVPVNPCFFAFSIIVSTPFEWYHIDYPFGIIKNQVCVIYIKVFLLRKLRNIQWDDCAKYNSLWIHITLHDWSDFLIIPLIPTSVYWCVGQSVHELIHSTQFCWAVRSLAINVTPFQSWKIPWLRKKKKIQRNNVI